MTTTNDKFTGPIDDGWNAMGGELSIASDPGKMDWREIAANVQANEDMRFCEPINNMNPLDQLERTFALDLMNPTPRSGRLQGGPRYRVTFDVDEETFAMFMNASELSGMIIECTARVTALSNVSAGPLSGAVVGDALPSPGVDNGGGGLLPTPADPLKKPPLGPRAMWLVQRCKEPRFWAFLAANGHPTTKDEESARKAVLLLLSVRSRRDVDGDPGAVTAFTVLLRLFCASAYSGV